MVSEIFSCVGMSRSFETLGDLSSFLAVLLALLECIRYPDYMTISLLSV